MNGTVLRACARTVLGRAVALHVAAAVALVALTASGLEHESLALLVLRGVAVMLAAALALAVDEPDAQLLDATPTPWRHRVTLRALVLAAVVLPVWALAITVVELRGTDVPVAALTLELSALAAVGAAVPLALRRWWRMPQPAFVAGPLLFGAVLGAARLPERFSLLAMDPAAPQWQDAHLRWAIVLVAALAVLAYALGDPATARTRRPLIRRG